jgi:hypothetical protein
MDRAAIIALATIAFAACAGQPAYGEPIDTELALEALSRWPNGGDTQACAAQVHERHLTLAFVPKPELIEICGGEGVAFLQGCALPGEHTSVLIDERFEGIHDTVLEHELRHWLSYCTGGDGDGDHNDASVWY